MPKRPRKSSAKPKRQSRHRNQPFDRFVITRESFEKWCREGGLDILEKWYPTILEYRRRRKHPALNYKPDDDPDRNQLAFHESTAPVRIVLGGNQSGKSFCAAMEIYWICEGSHPHVETPRDARIYVISAEYRTIQEGIYRHLRVLLHEWNIVKEGAKIPGPFDVVSFIEYESKNGGRSRIDFISGHGTESARKKTQAAAVDAIFIDEEIDGSIWSELQARRLARGGRVVISCTAWLSPDWLTELEEAATADAEYVDLFRLDSKKAVEAGHISEGVYQEMLATLSDEDAEVRLQGRTRKSHGLVYPEFDRGHLVERFEIPSDWNRYCAIDPGYRTCAVLWGAMSPDEHLYLYRELYLHGVHYLELVHRIFQSEGYVLDSSRENWLAGPDTETIQYRLIDPAGFGHHETGEPRIAHKIAEYGLSCIPAINDVEFGIEAVRRMMIPGLDGRPGLLAFRDLRWFQREIRSYRRERDHKDNNRRERPDAPIKRNDHLMDCLRYICSGRPQAKKSRRGYAEEFLHPREDAFTIPASVSMNKTMKDHWKEVLGRQKARRRWGAAVDNQVGIGSEV